MGRSEGRSARDTRALILHAATRVMRRDGLGATLEDIAAEAGISKGGLVYHFESKQALFVALGESISQGFSELLDQCLDSEDHGPGTLTRAYIRATFAELEEGAIRDNIVLAAHLITDPDLRRIPEEDGRYWYHRLMEDGLPSSTVSLIIAACIGVTTGPLWGSSPSVLALGELEAHLLQLTHVAEEPGERG